MRTPLLASLLCSALLTMTGCDDAPDAAVENPTAGERVAAAGEKAGDVLDDAAEQAGEVAGEITDDTVQLARQTREQGQRAADAIEALPSDAEAIYDLIAQLAEAAMQPGEFDELVERLSEADRARIGDYAVKDHPDLRDITGQAAAAWNKRYGEPFDIDDETAVLGSTPVTLGAEGRTATVPLAGMKVPLVREAGGWRIDAPDALTGEGLKNALIQRLDAIAKGTTPLPEPEREAMALVAQQVLNAILTTDQPESPAVRLR